MGKPRIILNISQSQSITAASGLSTCIASGRMYANGTMKKMSHTATHVRMIAKAMMSGRMEALASSSATIIGAEAPAALQRRESATRPPNRRRGRPGRAPAWHPPPSMPSLFSEILTIINIVVPTAVGNGLEYLPVLIGMALVGHSQSPNTKDELDALSLGRTFFNFV